MAENAGMTIAQKIFARAAGRTSVAAGEIVTAAPDYTVTQELYFWKNLQTLRRLGIERLPHPEKVVAVVDHTPQAATGSVHSTRHRELMEFARATGFSQFYPPGRAGLRHQVMVEEGYARPGLLVVSDEGNLASMGALGALNVPMSWETLVTLIQEDNWFPVPHSVRFDLVGTLPFGVTVRDLVQEINKRYARQSELVQTCVEFFGPAIASLDLDERQALLAGMYHTGADTAVMEVDDVALRYVEERAQGRPYEVMTPDPDAVYSHRAELDLSTLEPYVTVPPTHDGVVPVSELRGMRVTHAMIGSCGGNRMSDLRATAEILRGRKVHPHVTMYITPGSPEIYRQAAAEGLLEVFADAGAAVLTPSCSTCWGYLGALNAGDVAITSHQEHYRGRMGSREADVYISGPYAVAAAAVSGEVVDPREVLGADVKGVGAHV